MGPDRIRDNLGTVFGVVVVPFLIAAAVILPTLVLPVRTDVGFDHVPTLAVVALVPPMVLGTLQLLFPRIIIRVRRNRAARMTGKHPDEVEMDITVSQARRGGLVVINVGVFLFFGIWYVG